MLTASPALLCLAAHIGPMFVAAQSWTRRPGRLRTGNAHTGQLLMNRQLVIGGIAGALAVTAIGAMAGYNMMDRKNYAQVVSVRDAMKSVNVPRESCQDEVVTVTRPTKDPHQIAGTVVGAVIGGVIGNQFGSGKGKDVATGVGAVGGGYAGNKVQENMQDKNTHQETQRKCRTVMDSRREQTGYDVTYRYNGRTETVRMDHDPGKRIAIVNGEPDIR